jgi:hypothetical protein
VKLADHLHTEGLAANTRSSYATAYRNWLRFCSSYKQPVDLPISPTRARLWIAYLSTFAKPTTIITYSHALSSIHSDAGEASPFVHPSVRRTLRGVQRAGRVNVTTPKLPVTPDVISKIIATTKLTKSHTALLALAATAMAGLFRIGELCPSSRTGWAPRMQHFRRHADHITIHLPHSKTDTRRKGVDVVISSEVAVALVDRMLADCQRSDPQHFLFSLDGGKSPLTRKVFLNFFSLRIRAAGISMQGHSGFGFRRGGASHLAAEGVPEYTIQHLGRWSSQCFKLYTEYSTADKVRLARRL